MEKGDITVFDKIAEKVDNIYPFNREEILLTVSDIIFTKRDEW